MILTKGVILAGSPAGRPPLGAGVPAPLAPVANRPIVTHAVERLRAAGVDEVAVVSPPALERDLQRALHGLETRQLRQSEGNGLAGALRAAASFVGDDPFVLQTGDGLLGGAVEPFADVADDDGPDTVLLVHRDPAIGDTERLDSRRMLRMADVEVDPAGLAVAGVSVFGPGALGRAQSLLQDRPQVTRLADVVEVLWRAGGHVHVRMVRSWRRYDGAVENLLDLNRMVLEGLEVDREPQVGEGTRVQGRVVIDPTARVRASIIRGPVIIGARAQVDDAYIGPYTSIGADVQVQGAEIEHSIVLDGASICHISERLEASIVGRRARVFRDFSLPRAMRLHVGDGVEVALC
ncbi:MAG: glucose-phosphate thymidylyltransferase [Solirubrobacteraceae bacterium]